MTEMFEPDEGLTRRLRALGQAPVDPSTQSRHLTAMAEAAVARSPLSAFGNRLRVAIALVVGFLLGTTGLASAGALGPLQPIAHTTLDKVGVNVPSGDDAGTARYRGGDAQYGDCDASITGYKNRGQYLKAVREKHGKDSAELQAAKDSKCGMPMSSLSGGDEATDDKADDTATDDDAGKPASPGTSEEKKADAADKADKAKDNGKSGEAKDGATGAPENPGKAEADCAGGTDNGVAVTPPSTTPVSPTAERPACSDDKDEAGTDSSSEGDNDKPADEPASDQGPVQGQGHGQTSSAGS